jgi:ketol-acid reductoisomerase
MLLMPDEHIGDVHRSEIEPNLKRKAQHWLLPMVSDIHYGQVNPREDIDVVMVAPKAPGHTVRSTYAQGGGVPDAGRRPFRMRSINRLAM